MHAAEQPGRTSPHRGDAWRKKQPGKRGGRLIFIDETWINTNMTRLYGRAPKGQRLVAAAPHDHWKTSTFIAGLCSDSLLAPTVPIAAGDRNGAKLVTVMLSEVERDDINDLAQADSFIWR